MPTNSQKTCTKALKDIGWQIGNTESYSVYTGCSNDLWGFLDAVGVTPFRVVGLQFCGVDYASHIAKIEPLLTAHKLNTVSDTYLIGCKKVKVKKSGKAERWAFRVGFFESAEGGAITYREIIPWKDKQFNLRFLIDIEEILFKAKIAEVLKNEKRNCQ